MDMTRGEVADHSGLNRKAVRYYTSTQLNPRLPECGAIVCNLEELRHERPGRIRL